MSDTYDRPLDCLAESDAKARPVWTVRPDQLAGFLAGLDGVQAEFLIACGFTGAAQQFMLVPGQGGLAGAAVGLGEDRSAYAFGDLPRRLPSGFAWRFATDRAEAADFAMADAVLGVCLGAYRAPGSMQAAIAKFRFEGDISAPASAARAAWLVRDLVNAPANALGSAELADAALAVAAAFGAETRRIEGAALEAAYPAVAAVGRGSERAPVVAAFHWTGSGARASSKVVSLCGKGVCFDTGGYDLKPAASMLRMKKDMGGAALMLGVARMVMAADLPVRLHVRLGCVENSVSGRAMRPLDVIDTRRGLRVEVGNTDAEGRLVLCDLLAEASDERPDLLIDAATLTGAARVALGPDLPALFCNDDALAARVLAAGLAEHDPLWRLPLHDGYDSWLASPAADLNNVAVKPGAGAVVAALFLRRFVAAGVPWAHVDTYAWNDAHRPGRPEGGEALALRALFRTIKTFVADQDGDETGNANV